MTKRCYYAATLRGTNPGAIDEVYSFDYYSQREQWITEDENRVKLLSKLAKKHTPIEVTFEHHVTNYGYAGWVWMYNGFPQGE